MGASYYDMLLPVREPEADLHDVLAGIGFPCRVLASVQVPGGRIVLGLVSDSSRLSRMFAANWARAGTGQQPDATLYALAPQACAYGLDDRWNGARWWSREHKMMLVFGCGSYRLAKVCVRGICSAVSADDMMFVHGCVLSLGAGPDPRRGVVITGRSGAGKTTLVAGLLRHPEYSMAVLNDDWGAVALGHRECCQHGGKDAAHEDVQRDVLRPGFFTSAPPGSYSRDLSDQDRAARMLVSPESVYGAGWSTARDSGRACDRAGAGARRLAAPQLGRRGGQDA